MSDELKRKAVLEAERIYDTQSEFSIKRTLVKYYLQNNALEKEFETLQDKYSKVLDMIIDLRVKYEPEKLQRRIDEITEFLGLEK